MGFFILIEAYIACSYNISTILQQLTPWCFSFLLRLILIDLITFRSILPPPPWGFSFLLRLILIDHITFRQSYLHTFSMGYFILIEAYIDCSYNISTILPPPPWGFSFLLRLILIDHITFRQSYHLLHGVFHSYWGIYWLIM